MKVAYLGPVGSYSYVAARALFDADELVPYRDFDLVFAAAESAECDYAVVPIENSIEGNVNVNLDLLISTPLHIVAEKELLIDNRVYTVSGHGEITRILSHPQAYSQCRKNLAKLYPYAEFVPALSTAEALTKLDKHTAAVAGAQNMLFELDMGAPVSDSESNVTRFLVLAPTPTPIGKPTKISMVFEAYNRPGGLVNLLEIFDDYNLDMTAIESRPHKTALGRYFFYVDILGDMKDKTVGKAMKEVAEKAPYFKLLGNYEAAKHEGKDSRNDGVSDF